MANAKVEVAVQLAQRWIHARLRNRRFTSLTELNAAIRALLETFNNRRTRHLGASRRELFERVPNGGAAKWASIRECHELFCGCRP